jgi:phosphogluconate dehydratase
MPSGLSNEEKARVRKLFAEGKATREELLEAEARSYHSPGTCTFYGTANSNQMFMEMMGLHLPGASFVNPGTPLRDALTVAATHRASEITSLGDDYRPIGRLVDERAIVNAVIGLHATGGSTNHLLHLVAIAAAAGIELRWRDFDELARVVPLLARIYPNGSADVNHFERAGGLAFVIGELLDAGLLHGDIETIVPGGMAAYRSKAMLDGEHRLQWVANTASSGDLGVVRPVAEPFRVDGGMRVLEGNLGSAVIKVSAVAEQHLVVEAPAIVFDEQDQVIAAFKRGELDRDFVAVVRFQGPRANGMPELHKLTPTLSVLMDRGFRVALVTDGRMSGASGRVPAAIHVTPEAGCGGGLARVRDGDVIRVDADNGHLVALVDVEEWAAREPARQTSDAHAFGVGRELFGLFRRSVGTADKGASIFGDER